ncbi:hypothetical protein [Nocardioides sp. SR21]|uniref:hypothetical protein n=1 Tax=Nocardioides sp. SR21 TaxID=2919501 RepID=UPI001FAAFC0F|nr:hypothetical protein [Nocardioides sp. SR21]
MLRRWVPAVVAVVAVLAAGCGSESGGDSADTSPDRATDTATPSETAEPLPAGTLPCAVVWEERATLPRGYKGCAEDAGTYVPADPLACESGQKIIRYDDRFYAVPGGVVHAADAPLSEDPEYRAAALRCRA